MVKKTKSKIIKTELVEEEEDLDCFGNYDPKEVMTCQQCALKGDCSVVTEDIKKQRFNFRPRLRQVIDDTKEKIQESPQVVELIRKVKTKQKKLEKTMPKIVKKSSKGDEGGTKVVKKKVVEEETPKKKVKAESSEKPNKEKSDVETLHNSAIPTAFKALYKGVKELGTMEKKTSVTNIRGEHGILFCFPVAGRTSDKLEIFVNRSGEYKFKDFKHVDQKVSKKGGETFLVVKANPKSITEALEKLGQWVKDQPKHLATHSAKKGPKNESGGEKKAKKGSEKEGKKLVKKVVKEEEKPSKKEKKGAPVIKPSKKKVVVDDEEG